MRFVNYSKPQGFLLHECRVLLDGSRRPHMERLESRCLSMDAWERHLIFPLFSQDKAGSICGSWVSYTEGRVETDSSEDESYCGLVAWETLECGGGSGTLQDSPT